MKLEKLPSLLSLFLLVTLSSCDNGPSSRSQELRAEINQINQNYFEAQQTTKRLEAQLEAVRVERQKLEDTVKKAQEERDASKTELERVKQEFDVYKSKYKVSVAERVPGLQLPDFETSGKAFSKVVVTQLDGVAIGFNHAGGMAKMPLAELPDATKDVLGLTSVHYVVPVKEEAGKPLSAAKQRMQKLHAVDLEVSELEQQSRDLTDTATDLNRELGEAQRKLAVAKATKGNVVLLSDYAAKVQLQIDQVKAQQSDLQIKKHVLYQRRAGIR
jgi:chromosome segregation ATPase